MPLLEIPMIQFTDVAKVYPNGTVGLKDVNLRIDDGEFIAIIGRSGAGKSTLLRSINRMHPITSGNLNIDDVDVEMLSSRELRRLRRRIGMIFQSFNLVTRTTVIRNVLTGESTSFPVDSSSVSHWRGRLPRILRSYWQMNRSQPLILSRQGWSWMISGR